MAIQSVSFGNGQKSGSLMGAVKDSAINVGVTSAVGIAAGGAIGKVASFVPYKPSEAALKFQYVDLFEKAINTENLPKCLQGKSDDILGLVNITKPINAELGNIGANMQKTRAFGERALRLSDEAFASDEFKTAITEFFKDAPDSIPQAGFTKETLAQKLNSMLIGMADDAKAKQEIIRDAGNSFVEKVSGLDDIKALAESGAKHLRARSVIGAGMAIGLVTALVLNILKTHGAFDKKANETTASNMQNKRFTHQG